MNSTFIGYVLFAIAAYVLLIIGVQSDTVDALQKGYVPDSLHSLYPHSRYNLCFPRCELFNAHQLQLPRIIRVCSRIVLRVYKKQNQFCNLPEIQSKTLRSIPIRMTLNPSRNTQIR